MGRRKKSYTTIENLDMHISDVLRDGIQEIAFDPNKDIYNLKVKKKKSESRTQFRKRQNRKIKYFVEKYLYIDKDGQDIPIKLIAKQVILIADVFYRRKRNGKRANKIILWAARGGGKGVTISVLLFLLMVYKNRSALDLAGCLTGDSFILTKEGWKLISEMQVGNEVLTRKGWKPVLDVIPRKYKGDAIKLRLWGWNRGTKFTPDHKLFAIKTGFGHKRWAKKGESIKSVIENKKPEWIETQDLEVGDIVCSPIENSLFSKFVKKIKLNLSRNGIGKKKSYVKVDTSIMRFFGYWLAEGCAYKSKNGDSFISLTFGVGDEEKYFVNDCVNIIKKRFKRNPYVARGHNNPNSKNYNTTRIVFGNKDLVKFLKNNFGTGARNKSLPDWIFEQPKHYIMNLLSGLFRGDGTCGCVKHKGKEGTNQLSYLTSSSKLSSGIYRLLFGIGIPCSLSYIESKDHWSIDIYGKFADELIDIIFNKRDLYTLNKNYRTQKYHINSKNKMAYTFVKSLEWMKIKERVWDLKVAGDHCFSTPWCLAHNSADQAMVVYEYTKNFLSKCIPIVADKLLDGNPLQSKTKLKNGVHLKCIANSPTQTRGKHPPVLAADEACQEDTGKDKNVKSAINMVFSEKDYIVMLFSTWHVPIGIFQEYWDQADKRGFVKYKWDVFDTAQKCTLPDKCIFCNGRDKDCEYCLGKGKVDCKKCKLTEKINEYDLEANLIGFSYEGCNGKCLKTSGYAPIENIFDAKATNDPETWKTEFECRRPRTKGPVYNLESVWDCFVYNDDIILPKHETTRTIGVDWGWAGQTSIIGPAVDCEGYVSVLEEFYKTKPSISEIINYLMRMKDTYGEFMIFADSSHPFENASLVEAGFGLWYDKRRRDTEAGVVFNKWKDWGIGNLRKYWDKTRIKISLDNCPDLWEYLKIYKMGDDGKPIKKMDHGPDALLCAMLGHPFVEEALSPKRRAAIAAERKDKGYSHKDTILTFGGTGDGKRKKNR